MTTPVPPREQVALRARVEAVVDALGPAFTVVHEDRDEEHPPHGVTTGWGSLVEGGRLGRPVEIWFDGVDHDIALFVGHEDTHGLWREWRDLTDMTAVLGELEAVLRAVLAGEPRRAALVFDRQGDLDVFASVHEASLYVRPEDVAGSGDAAFFLDDGVVLACRVTRHEVQLLPTRERDEDRLLALLRRSRRDAGWVTSSQDVRRFVDEQLRTVWRMRWPARRSGRSPSGSDRSPGSAGPRGEAPRLDDGQDGRDHVDRQ